MSLSCQSDLAAHPDSLAVQTDGLAEQLIPSTLCRAGCLWLPAFRETPESPSLCANTPVVSEPPSRLLLLQLSTPGSSCLLFTVC